MSLLLNWVISNNALEQIRELIEKQEKLYERRSELQVLLETCPIDVKDGSVPTNVQAEDWSRSFDWDSQADDIRFNVFGISSYRPNQREVGCLIPLCLITPFFVLFLLGYDNGMEVFSENKNVI